MPTRSSSRSRAPSRLLRTSDPRSARGRERRRARSHRSRGPRRSPRSWRAREHLPPDPAALHPWFPEELREEVRLPAQDCDRVANDPPSDDGDVEAIRVRRERVTEEPDEVAVAQVSERGEAQAGAGGEIARARPADAGLEARLGHRAGWSPAYYRVA